MNALTIMVFILDQFKQEYAKRDLRRSVWGVGRSVFKGLSHKSLKDLDLTAVGLNHIKMDNVSPLPFTIQKLCQDILDTNAAFLH